MRTKLERIASIEAEIKQLENQRKQLLQQHKVMERKARTHRLCKRGGLLESMLPEMVGMTDEQFRVFLEKTMFTDAARRMLAALQTEPTETTNDEMPASRNREETGNDANRKNDIVGTG